MPLVTTKKAIRFHSLKEMNRTIQLDGPYQYRHLILSFLGKSVGPQTRRHIHDCTGVPINAIPRTVSTMVDEGVLLDAGKVECHSTGHMSGGVTLNGYYTGRY